MRHTHTQKCREEEQEQSKEEVRAGSREVRVRERRSENNDRTQGAYMQGSLLLKQLFVLLLHWGISRNSKKQLVKASATDKVSEA